jgi:hypothetical protein
MIITDKKNGFVPENVSFDKEGELNAYSKIDAIKKLSKYAAENQGPSWDESVEGMFSAEEGQHLMNRFGISQNARSVLGSAMASPVKTYLEYMGVMRKAFKVDPLANGAIPMYDKDSEDLSAGIVASQGAATQIKFEGERYFVPMLEIAANPTVKLREVKLRRFNLIDRIQVRTRQFIMEQEDALLISVLDTASQVKNNDATELNVSLAAGDYIHRKDMVNLKRTVERWDLFGSSYFMGIYRFNDIAMWDTKEVDILTQKQLVDTGLLARLHNMNIYVTKKIAKSAVYATATPDYVGVMPIYQDIEVLPADRPEQTLFGWVFCEIIGAAVTNAKGVARMTVTNL